MTASAVSPWCGWSHGPPSCLHVIVFIRSLLPRALPCPERTSNDDGTLKSRVILSFCEGSGPHAARPSSGGRGGARAVPRTRLRGDDDRGHQRPLRRSIGDGVPTLLLEARDPQGLPRHVHRR